MACSMMAQKGNGSEKMNNLYRDKKPGSNELVNAVQEMKCDFPWCDNCGAEV